MNEWIGTILTASGTSIITCLVMEAYQQRVARSPQNMGDHDEGME